MMKDGKLYVPNAEEIIPNLEKLYNYDRKNEIQIMGSADYHTLQDEEISDNPDYLNTFPPHCFAASSTRLILYFTLFKNPSIA